MNQNQSDPKRDHASCCNFACPALRGPEGEEGDRGNRRHEGPSFIATPVVERGDQHEHDHREDERRREDLSTKLLEGSQHREARVQGL